MNKINSSYYLQQWLLVQVVPWLALCCSSTSLHKTPLCHNYCRAYNNKQQTSVSFKSKIKVCWEGLHQLSIYLRDYAASQVHSININGGRSYLLFCIWKKQKPSACYSGLTWCARYIYIYIDIYIDIYMDIDIDIYIYWEISCLLWWKSAALYRLRMQRYRAKLDIESYST